MTNTTPNKRPRAVDSNPAIPPTTASASSPIADKVCTLERQIGHLGRTLSNATLTFERTTTELGSTMFRLEQAIDDGRSQVVQLQEQLHRFMHGDEGATAKKSNRDRQMKVISKAIKDTMFLNGWKWKGEELFTSKHNQGVAKDCVNAIRIEKRHAE
ncbi:hypothetical protein BC940DRAFT_330744 [Gongronella butleri]|nr:hypothetical protein BC940DRAFT_330744 [Gongronella butleri]